MGIQQQRGQSALEFALMLPALLLILGGTIQFGQAFLAYAQLMQAPQQGARYGAVLPNTGNDAAIIARATNRAGRHRRHGHGVVHGEPH